MKYPILIFEENAPLIWGYLKEDKFTVTTQEMLDTAVYDAVTIIDASGSVFDLTGARKIGWGNAIGGFHPFIKGRLIKVEPIVTWIKAITLPDLKAVLRIKITENALSWEDLGGAEELIAAIAAKHSIQDIIKIFAH